MSRTKVGERVRINFYFDAEIFEALKQIAVLNNVTYSELIRMACREFVVREGPAAIAGKKIIKQVKP
jgi:hypothetical protein